MDKKQREKLINFARNNEIDVVVGPPMTSDQIECSLNLTSDDDPLFDRLVKLLKDKTQFIYSISVMHSYSKVLYYFSEYDDGLSFIESLKSRNINDITINKIEGK